MPVDLLNHIRSLHDSLPRAERGIADLVLQDPGTAAERTISELARACGTSEATVHRFCRSLDLRGYAQLRIGLAAEAERLRADGRAVLDLGTDIGPDEPLDQVVRKIGFANARAAEETAAQLDLTALAAVADAAQAARRIDFFGVGSSALAAEDGARKLLRLGHAAAWWSDVHAALMSAAVLRPGDLVIAVSHSGRSREVVDVLTEARRSGAVTAVITSSPRSPAAEKADLMLTTSARETTFRSGGTAARSAQLTALDCLYVTLAQRSHPRAVDDLERAHDAVRSRTLGRTRS
ncbi:MurR/RpiR family transcriptional regulator [Kitasatospora sp. NBC_00240]|uniref:MurR/RpiR family transcriptional regulator n=1 Tax=Kitasatospora sp. NBC_00240 TaxID=2903567 RepID=UPI00224D3728|nr:MurR/RpiR family transcriptional regulator [Kitasatospora sp. NBC_00240]MCX5208452.1 MurR/RpiR family transcriptional regulator [Kitasatospora sp. NBC_00240]MCX5213331.1 MurR/RpiR family transcriptional regulator [Kitasatospora sp. NBC_00240]